jgi:nucleoside phosphorylase
MAYIFADYCRYLLPIQSTSIGTMSLPSEPPPPNHRDDFEIAILCALPLEAKAVGMLFDCTWEGLKFAKRRQDYNTYKTGMIGGHNVVLVFLPGMGKSNAASAASSCRLTFPNIKLALVVGICGGVPSPRSGEEILLGDVIISEGLVQYDFGRQFPDKFTKKSIRQVPNQEIRSYLASLKEQTGYDRLADRTSGYLKHLLRESKLDAKYPGAENDKLYDAKYRHKHQGSSCKVCAKCEGKLDEVCPTSLESTCERLQCNDNRLVIRNRLAEYRKEVAPTVSKDGTTDNVSKPEIHFGYFASGDKVMKSGEDRDELAASEDVIGFEMEGAGVWDNFPGCVVIKAVCDYADSHKNKSWQNYAAAVAAACLKAFLQAWAVMEKPTPRPPFGE